jgi:hypothetical protein
MSCCLLVLPLALIPAEDPKAKKLTATELQLEINVLRTLYYLQSTPEQEQAILKIARETAGAKRRCEEARVSKEYKRLLVEVRNALAEDDEDQVETLEDQLEELAAKEKPEIDDEIEITPAARKRAPELLRKLRTQQVAAFIGMYAVLIDDPRDRLFDALNKVRDWQLAEWQEQRDSLGKNLGLLIGGLDTVKAEKVRGAVVDLLAEARTLKEAEFASRRAELEKRAEEIVGQVQPTDVLKHVVEKALAEMLSNPRLVEALQARAK